jgi:hypothetical protein
MVKMPVNGKMNSHLLTGLRPITEYEVSLIAVFRNEEESNAVTLTESTGN